ncbi:hypothetical protein BC828DRAFT_112750 [Blastocladiella britannica]|nr:hypothetical protein BC828DRAFT_112750 [Blastocladiella britannica]
MISDIANIILALAAQYTSEKFEDAVHLLLVLPYTYVPDVLRVILAVHPHTLAVPAMTLPHLRPHCPRFDVHEHLAEIFQAAVHRGDTEQTQHLMDTIPQPVWDRQRSFLLSFYFRTAAASGQLSMLDWLWSTFVESGKMSAADALEKIPGAYFGHLSDDRQIAGLEWWLRASNGTPFSVQSSSTIWTAYILSTAASAGRVEILQWWLEHYAPLWTLANTTRAYYAASVGDRMDVVEWITRNVQGGQFRIAYSANGMMAVNGEDVSSFADRLAELAALNKVGMMDWWWARIIEHGFPVPRISKAVTDACKAGSMAALEWLWDRSLRNDEMKFPRIKMQWCGDRFDVFRWAFAKNVLSPMLQPSSLQPLALASAQGNLDFLTWWVAQGDVLPPIPSKWIVQEASRCGQLGVLDWWFAHTPEFTYDTTALSLASTHNRLAVLDWFWAKKSDSIPFTHSKRVLDAALAHGHRDVAQWWMDKVPALKVHAPSMHALLHAGDLVSLEWAFSKFPVSDKVVRRLIGHAVACVHIAAVPILMRQLPEGATIFLRDGDLPPVLDASKVARALDLALLLRTEYGIRFETNSPHPNPKCCSFTTQLSQVPLLERALFESKKGFFQYHRHLHNDQ